MSEVVSLLDGVDVFSNDDGGDLFSDADIAAMRGSEAQLVAIISDVSAPIARRFAAVEAALQLGLPADLATAATVAAIAEVAVQAMPRDQIHNRWGLPGAAPGRLGKRLLALPGFDGSGLAPLLDATKLIEIVGSESATIQDRRQYRIADLAAYLIARARGIDYVDGPDAAARDPFIATLRISP